MPATHDANANEFAARMARVDTCQFAGVRIARDAMRSVIAGMAFAHADRVARRNR